MDPVVARQLAVEVVRRVKGLMRVLDVVTGGGREEHRIAGAVDRRALETLERPAKIAEHLRFAPGQQAVTPQRRDAELLERRGVVARQLTKRVLAELTNAEVEEVIAIVLPADAAPQVGIDGADDDLVAEVIEEPFQ